jgi:hypothetical protein
MKIKPTKYPYEQCLFVGDAVTFPADKPLRFVQIAAATFGRRRGIKFKVSKVAASEGGDGNLLRMERVA